MLKALTDELVQINALYQRRHGRDSRHGYMQAEQLMAAELQQTPLFQRAVQQLLSDNVEVNSARNTHTYFIRFSIITLGMSLCLWSGGHLSWGMHHMIPNPKSNPQSDAFSPFQNVKSARECDLWSCG